MSKTNDDILYGKYKVCKADFERLHQLDSAEAKLRSRAELAAKTLADLDFTDTKNIKMIQKYIDTTFPNSLNLIEEKRQIILQKYKKRICLSPKFLNIFFNIAFFTIASVLLLIIIIYLIKTAGLI